MCRMDFMNIALVGGIKFRWRRGRGRGMKIQMRKVKVYKMIKRAERGGGNQIEMESYSDSCTITHYQARIIEFTIFRCAQ